MSSKKPQKEAVYEIIRAVLLDNEIKFTDGQNVAPLVNDDIKASIVNLVIEGLKNGEIALRDGYDMSKIESYTKGMVKNWFKKDKRLNGNIEHKTVNPGSRAGSSDPSVKEMKKLLKLRENMPEAERDSIVEAKIRDAISSRVKEIQKDKIIKSTVIDVNEIPDDLKYLVLSNEDKVEEDSENEEEYIEE